MTEATVTEPLQNDRYGRTRGPKRGLGRKARIAVIAVIILAVIVAAFVAFRPKTTPTTARTLDYSVIDSSSTHVTVGIFPDRSRDVHCIVQATNDHEAVVGFTEVMVAADPQANPNSPRQLDIDLATTQLASSGHVDSCWFE